MKRKEWKPKQTPEEGTQVLRHFETLFEKDKREAEERLAIIRVRIATLERAIAKEGKWIASS